MKDIFDQWLKEKLIKNPSTELDEKILRAARTELKGSDKMNWRMPLIGALAASVFTIWLMNQTMTISQITKMELSEPTEMIMQYEDIELMVESSEWTEEEWVAILAQN